MAGAKIQNVIPNEDWVELEEQKGLYARRVEIDEQSYVRKKIEESQNYMKKIKDFYKIKSASTHKLHDQK